MLYYVIISIIVVLDQVSKFLALKYVKPYVSIPILEDIFHLTYAENTGAAFSILSDNLFIITAITSVFTVAIFIYLQKHISSVSGFDLLSLTLSFILGGALGNLIDRIRLGYVVDFFEFRFIKFAIFNVADIFITVGSILLIIIIIIDENATR